MEHQEPMMLGSPLANSPSNTSLHHQSGSQFLPGFLMGDPASVTPILSRNTPGHSHLTHSASGQQNVSSFGNFTPKTSPPRNRFGSGVRFGSASMVKPPHPGHDITNSGIGEKDKPGAPPVSALINESNTSYASPLIDMSTPNRITDITQQSGITFNKDNGTPRGQLDNATQPRRILGSSNVSHILTSPPSPNQMDPFYTQGKALTTETELDETWVTIFGFPNTASSFILQQFSRCGFILEHHLANNDGNYMHVKFESKLQAKKALSKSGKILPGNMMIGVTPCIDLKVMRASNQENINASSLISPEIIQKNTPKGVGLHNVSCSRTSVNSPKPPTMRPIAAAYTASASQAKVFNDTRTPQKSNGIVSKTLDYLFG